MRALILLVASLAWSTLAPAQDCATVTVTGNGAPGTDLTFDLMTDGPAGSLAFILIGATAGSTSLGLGAFGTLNLGVAVPFIPLPMGFTDAGGDASLTLAVPADFDHAVLELVSQGLTAEWKITMPTGLGWPTLTLDFCTSNVAGFQVGG